MISKTLIADSQAHLTDFAALGLHNPSPFDILSRPRVKAMDCPTPGKRGPKTAAQRAAAITDFKKINFSLETDPQAARDKQARLIGKSNSARSE